MGLYDELPQNLFNKGLISSEQAQTLQLITKRELVSVHHELKAGLSLGAILLTTGTGLVIYENIDEIGRLGLLALMVAITTVLLWYSWTRRKLFSLDQAHPFSLWQDTISLLGYSFFGMTLGFIEYLYPGSLHGPRGVSLICAVAGFYWAYLQDHRGILSLAIIALASLFGLSLTITDSNIWTLHTTGALFGVFIGALGILLERKKIKAHFTLVYLQFSCVCTLVSLVLAATKINLWLSLLTIIFSVVFYKLSFKYKSLLLNIAAYVALVITGGVIGYNLIFADNRQGHLAFLWLIIPQLYSLASAIGLFLAVNHARKTFQGHTK